MSSGLGDITGPLEVDGRQGLVTAGGLTTHPSPLENTRGFSLERLKQECLWVGKVENKGV